MFLQIAEVCCETKRGRAFGIIQFALNSGQILSALLATPLSETMVAGTIHGWRVSFAIVGALSLLLCAALFLFMHEPERAAPPRSNEGRIRATFARVFSEGGKMLAYLRIPTFVVLVMQVCVYAFMRLWVHTRTHTHARMHPTSRCTYVSHYILRNSIIIELSVFGYHAAGIIWQHFMECSQFFDNVVPIHWALRHSSRNIVWYMHILRRLWYVCMQA
jgi:MFS family permease